MTVNRINVAQSLLPGKRLVKVIPTRMFAKPGDEVTLKSHAPSEFNNYKDLVGLWQGQVGDFSQVHFKGIGTVSVQSSYLIVM